MYEVETIITFQRFSELYSVWTNDPKWVRRILKTGLQPTKVGKREAPEPSSYWFDVPAELVRINIGKRRQKTEAQLKAIRENVKRAQVARQAAIRRRKGL